MIVVADASPLIFLSKIGRLQLIPKALGSSVCVPEQVRVELFAQPIDPSESASMEVFLKSCSVEAVPKPRRFAAGMSRADGAALTLAIRRKADFLLADDRILRQAAFLEGIRPMGTVGLLLRAQRVGILRSSEALVLINALIRDHGMRIGVELYQAIREDLDARH